MPTYEYVCEACDHAFEEFQSMSEKVLRKCPRCRKPKLRRLFGAGAGIIFKGSGFYETDYRKKSGGTERAADAKARADSKSESKTESKSEAKSEKKPDSAKKESKK